MNNTMPKSWNEETKPHLLCPGCGHGIALKHLGRAIDQLGVARKTTVGIDIGCSLLLWNFFNMDTIQTHHGRTTSVMVGYKLAKPDRIALAYMGDGGAYAIGLQYLLHAAYRNNPITAIVINNENYAMTGGQMSPTTPTGMVTSTSPHGKDAKFGKGLHGPELIKNIASEHAYIARASVNNPNNLQQVLQQAIETQQSGNFSFVEILSICPTNWRTDAKESFANIRKAEDIYPLGEVK